MASSHNAAAAGEAAIGRAEAGQEVSAAVTEALEVVTTGGGRGSVMGGDLEAMVDMEALLLQCCQQEATTHQQEAAASGLKESLMGAPTSLAI